MGSGQGRSQHTLNATNRPSKFKLAQNKPKPEPSSVLMFRVLIVAKRFIPFNSINTSSGIASSIAIPPFSRTLCFGVIRKGNIFPTRLSKTVLAKGIARTQPGNSASKAWRLPRFNQPTLNKNANHSGKRLVRSAAVVKCTGSTPSKPMLKGISNNTNLGIVLNQCKAPSK